jgi:hypothetical protein
VGSSQPVQFARPRRLPYKPVTLAVTPRPLLARVHPSLNSTVRSPTLEASVNLHQSFEMCCRLYSPTVSHPVDFVNVSAVGLESSPVVDALAGLRANEARYFKNKYDYDFTVEPAASAKRDIDMVHRILKEERDIVIASTPLEATTFQVENIRWTYVFYESGLSINVLYTLDGPNPKRAVGFKLSEGMDVPAELGSFKFARQKSKLAGTIRGSYFVIKGAY